MKPRPSAPGQAGWASRWRCSNRRVGVSNGACRETSGPSTAPAHTVLSRLYIECRSDRRHWVELRDLSSAYRSAAYTSNASEVEELHTQALGRRQSKQRLDLKCPFELPAAYRTNVVEFARAEREPGNQYWRESLGVQAGARLWPPYRPYLAGGRVACSNPTSSTTSKSMLRSLWPS